MWKTEQWSSPDFFLKIIATKLWANSRPWIERSLMQVALLPRRWLLFFCRATKATLRSFFGFFFLYLSLQLFHLLLERILRRLGTPTSKTKRGFAVAALMYWAGERKRDAGGLLGRINLKLYSLWSFALSLVVPVVSDKIASRRELDINQQSQSLAHCRQLDEGRIKQKLFMSSLTKTPSWEKSRAFVLCG